MNIFKRMLKIGQAEIHAFVERMEDPIVMMEEGLRSLKEELALSLEAFAKLKAMIVRSQNTILEKRQEAASYEEKAYIVLQKAAAGSLDEQRAEQLALEALKRKQALEEEANDCASQLSGYQETAITLTNNLEVLKFNIGKWEKELATLRAKHRAAETSAVVNRHIAQMETNSTIDLLKRMKDKVMDEAANAEVVGDFPFSKLQLDKLLDDVVHVDAIQEKIIRLKNKLGIK